MTKRWIPWLLTVPAALLIAFLLVLPVSQTLLEAMLPVEAGWRRYVAFFQEPYNRTVLFRTIEVAVVTTLISLTLGFVAAFYITRCSPLLRNILLVLSVFPLLTGAVVRAFAWIVILGRNGILNQSLVALGVIDAPTQFLFTKFALVVGLVYLFTPLAILSLVGVLDGIEEDVVDASASLGASPAGVFMQVTLPLAIPGLIVGGVLIFTGSLAAFATARLLGGDRQLILPTQLYEKAMVSFDWDAASVIATVMVVLTLVAIFVMSKLARRFNPNIGG